MKKLGIIANCSKPRAAAVLAELAERARDLDLELHASGETAAMLPGVEAEEFDDVVKAADAIVALGGDGTMLTAVRELQGADVPLIGVNIGSLGFMTSVAEQDLSAALECLLNETFIESERVIAECVVSHSGGTARYCALNDIVITSGASSRVITLDVSVGRMPVTSYVCDGLIVSTPTGSTGHSLSAGGPILTPETRAFVISPICPHTLSSRPLVVPDTSEVRIEINDHSDHSARLSVDGQVGLALERGDSIVVSRCSQNVRFLHLPDYSYFEVMRQKLRWRGSNV